MVGLGLSVVLEPQNDVTQKSPKVINKPMFIKPSSPTPLSPPLYTRWKPSTFLDYCFLCKQKLLPGKDIYMYKGDKAFCSEECRCRQIFMDDEESIKRDNCSLAALTMRPRPTESSSSASSSNAGNHKGTRNRANGFAC